MKQSWRRVSLILFVVFGALALSVFVVACGGGNSASESAQNPTPSIASLSPSSEPTGSSSQSISINGTGFLTTSTVTFNGVAHTSAYVNASQRTISLTAADLATVGNYAVIVTNPAPGGGASAPFNFAVVTKNPVPTIATLSPALLSAGATPQTLTINGTDFLTTSTVTFNGVAHTSTYVNASRLTISLTAADLATAGSYPVIVTNPAPGGGASASVAFGVWNSYTFQHTGLQISVPPTFIPRESTDPVSRQVVFSNSPNTSDSNVILVVKIAQLPQGLMLTDAIQNGGIDSSSISQVNIGSKSYLSWFSSGEGGGNWNFASVVASSEVVMISTPSSSFASSPIFTSIVSSLAF